MRDELYGDRARSAGGRFRGREPSRGGQAAGSPRTMEILQDSVYGRRRSRTSVASLVPRESTADPSAMHGDLLLILVRFLGTDAPDLNSSMWQVCLPARNISSSQFRTF